VITEEMVRGGAWLHRLKAEDQEHWLQRFFTLMELSRLDLRETLDGRFFFTYQDRRFLIYLVKNIALRMETSDGVTLDFVTVPAGTHAWEPLMDLIARTTNLPVEGHHGQQ
jgi:hypothetical protein